MKIGPADLRDPAPQLPLEVISCILSFALSNEHAGSRQNSLWSYCLVSNDWYSVTISKLYARPILGNRNFDQFARTICPPVNSHIPKIGLEDLVRDLDMGKLAYESSKSQTARLIRRCGRNLERFVAPAVSFSVSSLAPLSKCRNLKTLDISRIYSDVDMPRLLRASRNLMSLEELSLPPAVFRNGARFPIGLNFPPSLISLQFNGCYPPDERYWRELSTSWPQTLDSLRFNDAGSEVSSFFLPDDLIFSQITKLDLGSILRGHQAPLLGLLKCCPNMTFLRIQVLYAEWFPHWNAEGLVENVEVLEISDEPKEMYDIMEVPAELGSLDLICFPKVWRIRVQESIMARCNLEEMKGFETVSRLLQSRPPSAKMSKHGLSGLFTFTGSPDDSPSADRVWDDDVWPFQPTNFQSVDG